MIIKSGKVSQQVELKTVPQGEVFMFNGSTFMKTGRCNEPLSVVDLNSGREDKFSDGTTKVTHKPKATLVLNGDES